MTFLKTLEFIINVTQQQLAWGLGRRLGFVLFNLLISLKKFFCFVLRLLDHH